MEVSDGGKQDYDPVAWLSAGGEERKQQQRQSVRYSAAWTGLVLL